MDSGSTRKLRLVRCPNCRLLLPEPAHVRVYKCGGCGIVLQVKIRDNYATTSTSSVLREREVAQMNELEHVSQVTESISSSQETILPLSAESSFDQNNGKDLYISRDEFGGVNSSDEEQNNESDHNEYQDCNIEQQGEELSSSTEHVHLENEELSPLTGANSEIAVKNEGSLPSGTKLEVCINNESGSTFRSSNTDNIAASVKNNSTATSHRPAEESISSNILISSPDQQTEQLQTNFDDRDDCIKSNDPFETTNYFSTSSDLSGTLECMSKSPTTRSSRAYDGSISSYDGVDDQVPNQHLKSYRNVYNGVNSGFPEERSRRDNFLIDGSSEIQHQSRTFSSAFSDKRHSPMNPRKWNQNELLESTRYGLAVRKGTRLERDGLPPPVPLYQRNYPAGYESGSSSNQSHDESYFRSSEQDKIKLRRMVYELQDKLNRTCYVNERANRRVSSGVTWKEKHVSPYYSGEMPEEEIFPDLNYRRYPEMRRQGSNWSHQYKVSGIPFSAEATNNRCHIDSSCMSCCPQDWQYSAQQPFPILSHNKGFCRFHPGHSCYNSYRSCPSSPQSFTDSEFAIGCRETKSDDQRHEDHPMKRYVKEKHHLVKRHLRPTAGGAPFVTCYFCLKPLQLPADFLLFKRRLHQLRCGACSRVLEFSLESRTHLVPYSPKSEVHPPSEVDDCSDAINRRNLAPSSHSSNCLNADPMSCSDDYELSYCKSYSTDGDPVFLTSLPNPQLNANVRGLSYGSHESKKERKQLVQKLSQNKYKNPIETYESVGPSSNTSRSGKVSSEIEELPGKTGSPLHRLMGYSSPSQVLRGSGFSDWD